MGLFSHLLFPFPAQHITEGQRATLPPKLQPKPVELSETPCLALFSEEDNGWGIRLCGKFQVAAAVKNPTPPLGRLWVTSTHKTIVILCLCVCCSSLIFVHTEREVHTRPDLFSALPSRPNHEKNYSPAVSLLCNARTPKESVGGVRLLVFSGLYDLTNRAVRELEAYL